LRVCCCGWCLKSPTITVSYGKSLWDVTLARWLKSLDSLSTTELGYDGLAVQTNGFLQRLDMRLALIKAQERFHKQLLQHGIFRPQTPQDVLVQEQFIAGSQHIPPEIISLAQQAGVFSAGDARSVYTQGLFHDMQGDYDAALASYLEAVARLEVDRRNLRDEKARGTFLEDKIIVYYTPMLHLLERHRIPVAFELLERSRARGMADLLASKELQFTGTEERRLYAASVRLKTDISLQQKELFGLRSLPDREQYAARITATEHKISTLEAEYEQLLHRIRRQAPRLQELLASDPVSLQQLQHAMHQEHYEMLQYLVLESSIILWHISADSVHVRSVFLPRSELIAADMYTKFRHKITSQISRRMGNQFRGLHVYKCRYCVELG
jgi:hypothetical protein